MGCSGAPLASIAHVPRERLHAEIDTYFKASLGFALGLGLCATVGALRHSVAPATAALFGLYGSAMSLRLVARTY